MNLRGNRVRDDPEINFIPLIDVLLVILIFLMVTTTYQRIAELQITLPEANADPAKQRPQRDQRRHRPAGALQDRSRAGVHVHEHRRARRDAEARGRRHEGTRSSSSTPMRRQRINPSST